MIVSFYKKIWFWMGMAIILLMALVYLTYQHYYIPRRNLSENEVHKILATYNSLNDNSNQAALKQRRHDWSAQLPPKILGRFKGRVVEEVLVCFGDLCPENGRYFLRYQGFISQPACENMGGEPIIGMGWTEVYAGCAVKL